MRDPIEREFPVSRRELNKEPIGAFEGWLGAIILLLLAAWFIGPSVYKLLITEVGGVAVYLALLVGIACLAVAGFIYWARDQKNSRLVVILQISVAIAGGVVGVFTAPNLVAGIVVFLGAAVAVTDGYGKWPKNQ